MCLSVTHTHLVNIPERGHYLVTMEAMADTLPPCLTFTMLVQSHDCLQLHRYYIHSYHYVHSILSTYTTLPISVPCCEHTMSRIDDSSISSIVRSRLRCTMNASRTSWPLTLTPSTSFSKESAMSKGKTSLISMQVPMVIHTLLYAYTGFISSLQTWDLVLVREVLKL